MVEGLKSKLRLGRTAMAVVAISALISCGKDDGMVEEESQLTDRVEATGLLYDSFMGQELLVYSNSQKGVVVAFNRPEQESELVDFQPVTNQFPIILSDENGNRYDVFGRATSAEVQNLNKADGFMGFWFSIAAFYTTPTLFGEPEQPLVTKEESADWGVDEAFVSRGAPKDAIPAIDNPVFKEVDDTDRFLNNTLEPANIFDDDQRVLLVETEERFLILSYSILNWHEVVNGTDFGVNYCPLTGTAFAVDTDFGDFGVSGLLYNNNLIMFDRTTETYWSQIYLEAIHGESLGTELSKLNAQEMTWSAALDFAESTTCYYLTKDTGFARDYDFYPYGTYRTNQEVFLYENEVLDSRVPNKELVYAVLIDGKAKVYRFEDFTE